MLETCFYLREHKLCGQTYKGFELTITTVLSLQSTAMWNRKYYVYKFKFLNVFHNLSIVFSKCLFPPSKRKLVHTREWQLCTIGSLMIKWTLKDLKTNLGNRTFPSPLQLPLFSYLSCAPASPKVINHPPNLRLSFLCYFFSFAILLKYFYYIYKHP